MDKSTNIQGKELAATPVKPEDMMVQDRKTGEWYNVQERFEQIMNSEDILAVVKRLKEK